MQKVLRRTMLAEKQAVRRAAKRREKTQQQERKNTLEQARFTYREASKEKKAAALAQREDWELGPLAPKRDVGDLAGRYGTADSSMSKGPLLTKEEKWDQRLFVGGKYPTVVQGDRVAILQGREKGKIGTVSNMDFSRGECIVEGLNMIDIKFPEWMLTTELELDKGQIRSLEQPIPFSWIKLVIRLKDPETGELEDVVCDKVETTKPYFDKHATPFRGTKVSYNRFVRMPDGTKVTIPYPEKTGKKHKDDFRDEVADTLRMEVEQKTFVPTLLRPPMPGSVIDELRNKYSIFRTRHDPEYVAAKMKEDEEKEEKKKLIEKMRTPLKEINRLERKIKRGKGKGKLTDKMLEKIGKVIAQKKQLQLAAAGISKEPEVLAA